MYDLTNLNQYGFLPLTKYSLKALKQLDLVQSIRLNTDSVTGDLYPLDTKFTGWTRDNYGPI